MHWTVWTAIALLAFGMWGVMTRAVLSELDWRLLVLLTLATYALPVPVIWLFDPPDAGQLGWAAAVKAVSVGLLGQLGIFFFYQALSAGGKASVVVAMTALYPIITVMGAIFLLNESPSVIQLLGAVLAVLAVALLAVGSREAA